MKHAICKRNMASLIITVILIALLAVFGQTAVYALEAVNTTYSIPIPGGPEEFHGDGGQVTIIYDGASVYRFQVALPGSIDHREGAWVCCSNHWAYRIDSPWVIRNVRGGAIGTVVYEPAEEGNSYLGSVRWLAPPKIAPFEVTVSGKKRPWGDGGGGVYKEYDWNCKWKRDVDVILQLDLQVDSLSEETEDNPGTYIAPDSSCVVKAQLQGQLPIPGKINFNVSSNAVTLKPDNMASSPGSDFDVELPSGGSVGCTATGEQITDNSGAIITATFKPDDTELPSPTDTAKITVFGVEIAEDNAYKYMTRTGGPLSYTIKPSSVTVDNVEMKLGSMMRSTTTGDTGLGKTGIVQYTWVRKQGEENLMVPENTPFTLIVTVTKNNKPASDSWTGPVIVKVDLETNKPNICGGNVQSAVHQCNLIATLTPALSGETVNFELAGNNLEAEVANGSLSAPSAVTDADGKAQVTLTSSAYASNPTDGPEFKASIKASPQSDPTGFDTKEVTYDAPQMSMEFLDPTTGEPKSEMMANGEDQLKVKLTMTSNGASVDGHSIQWSFKFWTDDPATTDPVENPGAEYGSISAINATTNASGISEAIYTAGTMGGYIEFVATDNSVNLPEIAEEETQSQSSVNFMQNNEKGSSSSQTNVMGSWGGGVISFFKSFIARNPFTDIKLSIDRGQLHDFIGSGGSTNIKIKVDPANASYSGHKEVKIFNSSGIMVRHYDNCSFLTVWDGKNTSGTYVVPEEYTVKLIIGDDHRIVDSATVTNMKLSIDETVLHDFMSFGGDTDIKIKIEPNVNYSGEKTIKIFSCANGTLVRTFQGCTYLVNWNGKKANGDDVPAGDYNVQLSVTDSYNSGRILDSETVTLYPKLDAARIHFNNHHLRVAYRRYDESITLKGLGLTPDHAEWPSSYALTYEWGGDLSGSTQQIICGSSVFTRPGRYNGTLSVRTNTQGPKTDGPVTFVIGAIVSNVSEPSVSGSENDQPYAKTCSCTWHQSGGGLNTESKIVFRLITGRGENNRPIYTDYAPYTVSGANSTLELIGESVVIVIRFTTGNLNDYGADYDDTGQLKVWTANTVNINSSFYAGPAVDVPFYTPLQGPPVPEYYN